MRLILNLINELQIINKEHMHSTKLINVDIFFFPDEQQIIKKNQSFKSNPIPTKINNWFHAVSACSKIIIEQFIYESNIK